MRCAPAAWNSYAHPTHFRQNQRFLAWFFDLFFVLPLLRTMVLASRLRGLDGLPWFNTHR